MDLPYSQFVISNTPNSCSIKIYLLFLLLYRIYDWFRFLYSDSIGLISIIMW
jgi:hypothetical protein